VIAVAIGYTVFVKTPQVSEETLSDEDRTALYARDAARVRRWFIATQ